MRNSSRLAVLLTAMAIALVSATSAALAITIIAGNGDNDLLGTAEADLLDGSGGHDRIQGLAGTDTIRGGDGRDKLFGGDEALTTLLGDDDIRGQDGADEIIGGYGADVLVGGRGNDVIYDGPGDDGVADQINGGDDNDTIQSASIPASKDFVTCGPGTDDAQVDPLDVVASDCETVDVFERTSVPGATPEDTEGDPQYLGSEPESDTDPNTESDPVGPPPGGTSQVYIRDNFDCEAPPARMKMANCKRVDPQPGEQVGVGLFGNSDPRWIYVEYRLSQVHDLKGYGRIHKDHDAHDWLYTSDRGYVVILYAKTSKWSAPNHNKWTTIRGYSDRRS